MRYLLDTNTCIRYLNGTSDLVRKHIEILHPNEIAVCSIVKAELFYGAENSTRPKANFEKQCIFLEKFISLPFDDNAAEAYGRLRTQLAKAGTPIGPNDLLIAAIALTNNCILVSHNTKEFTRISELELEDWETE